jgi:ABC-type sugar transport system substrate-binding protein
VIDGPDCGVKINIIDKQTSNWRRDEAQNLMTNWLSTGTAFDGVIANNDESAIGAPWTRWSWAASTLFRTRLPPCRPVGGVLRAR